MSRIPYYRRDEVSPESQEVWDAIVGTRGAELTGTSGHLAGPFNAFVQAPAIGRHLTALGKALRYETSVDRRLLEVAIITMGAHWKAEFEWWAHAKMARRHGVSDAVIDAIGQDQEPPFEADDERIVYQAARQLARTGRLDNDAYQALNQLLGDQGTIELVSLCGFYTLISFLLNSLEVPLPPGTASPWSTPPNTSE